MLLFNPNGVHVASFPEDLTDLDLEEFATGFGYRDNCENRKRSPNAKLEQDFRFIVQPVWNRHDLDGVTDVHLSPLNCAKYIDIFECGIVPRGARQAR